MASVVTINRPDVVQLIEDAAQKFTGGNKTEAVALALKKLIEMEDRSKPLFGAHPGSVWVAPGVDLTQPTFTDYPMDAESKPWAANLDDPKPPKKRRPRK